MYLVKFDNNPEVEEFNATDIEDLMLISTLFIFHSHLSFISYIADTSPEAYLANRSLKS